MAFFVSFLVSGGLESLRGILMGVGLTGLGVLVLLFGLIVVSLAYRLEDSRLKQTYEELKAVLLSENEAAHSPSEACS
jgi:hypothetical protein